jgi:N-succinyldiaminopimelate aminotransferase
MDRRRPNRVVALTGIGVDRMGNLADEAAKTDPTQNRWLRMENLDVNIQPHPIVAQVTADAAMNDQDNSYLPFIGQAGLSETVAAHVSSMTCGTVHYTREKHCTITVGGLSGILNTLLATIEVGDGVLLFDPTYSGLINRVKLAGGVPVFVPLDFRPGATWRFNHNVFRHKTQSSNIKLTTMLLMSPSLPSGIVLDREDWAVVAEVCIEHDLLLILDTAMERLLFDDRQVFHPASLPGMMERTITVGSASKELRMIGWRVGWVVGPERLIADIRLVGMANVVVPVGIAQRAAAAALEKSGEDLPAFVRELQSRRDVCMSELSGLPIGIPSGGWSFLLRVDGFGLSGAQASDALLKLGVCVTPMDGWGEEHGSQYVRFVFSNEPCHRIEGLGVKVRTALGVRTDTEIS